MITDPYREYYLATEEAFELGQTVGVTDKQWKASHLRLNNAIEACELAEKARS